MEEDEEYGSEEEDEEFGESEKANSTDKGRATAEHETKPGTSTHNEDSPRGEQMVLASQPSQPDSESAVGRRSISPVPIVT